MTWLAARNGLPGDQTAVNHASQVDACLVTHGITPVYQGNRVLTVASTASPGYAARFLWVTSANPGGWLPLYDVDQPFVVPSGVTAIGRITAAVQAAGDGADLQVTLYPDNGSGDPLLTSPLASTVIPAAHITALGAAGSLAGAGPLQTAQFNTLGVGTFVSSPWAQPAVDSGGAGNFAAPVTSGNWTLFIGGTNHADSSAINVVSAVQYLGSGMVSGAIPQPPLPQATTTVSAAATPDTLVVAGGFSGSTQYANVWAASWDPSTGTLGSWSAQQALPTTNVGAGMAAWDETVYLCGGSTAGTLATIASSVYYATVTNGQITAWTTGPPLPQPAAAPFAAVVGNWLIVAGGQNSSGAPLSQTWFSKINSDGSLAGWQAGPDLPQPAYALIPGWNTAVTDSAMILVSGNTTSGSVASVFSQILTVSDDGPAAEWELQGIDAGSYQCGVYPSGTPGQWQAFQFQPSAFGAATVSPVPLVSVPLPAAGLTPGDTYHLMFRQLGGDTLNNYLQLGELAPVASATTQWLYSPQYSGGPWTAPVTLRQLAVDVYDQTPGGQPLHLVEDGWPRITTLVWGTGTGQLLGCCESTVFAAGPLNSNPTFTSTLSPWEASGGTITQSNAETHGGYPYSALLTPSGTAPVSSISSEEITVTQDEVYLADGWFLSPPGTTDFSLTVSWYDNAGDPLTPSADTISLPAGTWTQVSNAFTAPAGAAKGQLVPAESGTPATTALVYCSDVTLTAADPGVLASAAAVSYGTNGLPATITQLT